MVSFSAGIPVISPSHGECRLAGPCIVSLLMPCVQDLPGNDAFGSGWEAGNAAGTQQEGLQSNHAIRVEEGAGERAHMWGAIANGPAKGTQREGLQSNAALLPCCRNGNGVRCSRPAGRDRSGAGPTFGMRFDIQGGAW